MSLYQHFVSRVLYPLDLYRDGEYATLKYLREYERSQYQSTDALERLTWDRKAVLLEHAYQHCPYYRRRFDAADKLLGDIRTLNDLLTIPTLKNINLQEQRKDIVSENWPRHDLVLDRTGGSTGTPISYYRSHDRNCSGLAATIRHDRWAGRLIGDRSAKIWGDSRDFPQNTWKQWARNWFVDRTVFQDTGYIDPEELIRFNESLKRFRPKTILAYAKSVVLLAQVLKDRGIVAYQPYSIITSAEVLDPEDRILLEDVFGYQVFNRHGCREMGIIASECAEHKGLHVRSEGILLEVVCGRRHAQTGEMGEVIVTDLLNFAMPMIRYRIGDMAVSKEGDCVCGRGLPRLQKVEGRVTDFLVGSDGRLVSGAFLTVAMVAKRHHLDKSNFGRTSLAYCSLRQLRERVKPRPSLISIFSKRRQNGFWARTRELNLKSRITFPRSRLESSFSLGRRQLAII